MKKTYKDAVVPRLLNTEFGFNPVYQRLAIIGLMLIIIIMVASFASNLITKIDPNLQGDLLNDRYLAPSWDHPFGTDKFGRDIFSRVLFGGRISLTIGISVVFFSVTIGIFYGAISGFFGGYFESVLMRILDFLLAFPTIFLIITIVAIFNPGTWYLIPLLGLTSWMETARLVRAEVLSIKTQDYILAAKGLGIGNFRVLFRHIIPNCLTPVFVAMPFMVGSIILLESALSFLGLGVQPPIPSWGNIIHDGSDVMMEAWWVTVFPGLCIVITVMSFNFITEGLRVLLAPKN